MVKTQRIPPNNKSQGMKAAAGYVKITKALLCACIRVQYISTCFNSLFGLDARQGGRLMIIRAVFRLFLPTVMQLENQAITTWCTITSSGGALISPLRSAPGELGRSHMCGGT